VLLPGAHCPHERLNHELASLTGIRRRRKSHGLSIRANDQERHAQISYGPMSRRANGGNRPASFYKGDLISLLKGMVCSASSAERCNHLTFSTKAWYAAFLLSKNSIIGRKFSSGPAVLSTKAWYAAFLLSKNLIIGPEVSRPARHCLIDTSS
jgi:hypothetical protein